MKNIISKITNLGKNKTIQNSMYLTISRFLRYGLMFIFTAICAQYLTQDEYGLISYNLSQVGIITLLFSLGADTYIVIQLAKDREGHKTNNLISTNTLNRVALMIIVTTSIMVLNRFINIYRFDLVATLIYMTAIMDSFRTISDGYFQSKENLKLVAILEVLRAVFLLVGVIIASSLNLGLIGIAFVYNISSTSIFLISAYFIFIKYKIRLVSVKLKDSINLIKVSLPFFLNATIAMISVQLDVIMINAIGGNVQTGIYATAKKILDIVLMIPGIISMVLLPKISNGEINKKNANKIIGYIFAIGIVISGGVFIFSKYVIIIAFGIKYVDSYSIIKIFCLAFPFIFVNAFLSSFLTANGRQKKVLYINSFGTIANIILNSILIPLHLSRGAAIATVITIFINLIQFYVYYKKENFNCDEEGESMTSFYSETELLEIGFNKVGKNVLISRKCSIYSAENISIGNNVRIDDFALLSGNITIGDYVHISAYVALFAGDYGIELHDFTGVSSRTTIYAISDDYSGAYMTNPMVLDCCRNVQGGKVILKKHALIGASSLVLPGVTLEEGAAVGSCTFVNKDCPRWTLSIGSPARVLKERKKDILELEEKYYSNRIEENNNEEVR